MNIENKYEENIEKENRKEGGDSMITIDDVFNSISEGRDFYISLGNFLDDFYNQTDDNKSLILKIEPKNYNVPIYQKAFLASTIHKLANDFNLEVPTWVFESDYYSYDKPYFDCNAKGNLRKLFLYKSPIEFKHRNIFVDENILKRV